MNRTSQLALAPVALAVAALALTGCAPTVHPAAATTSIAPAPTSSTSSAPVSSPTASSPAVSTAPSVGPSGNTMTADAIQDLQDAVSSGNTAALEGYCAPTVHVVTTEGVDATVPASGVDGAVQSGVEDAALTATWNWSIPAPTLAAYRTGPHAALFPTDGVIGASSTGYVISFTVVGAQITAILMSRDATKLT